MHILEGVLGWKCSLPLPSLSPPCITHISFSLFLITPISVDSVQAEPYTVHQQSGGNHHWFCEFPEQHNHIPLGWLALFSSGHMVALNLVIPWCGGLFSRIF